MYCWSVCAAAAYWCCVLEIFRSTADTMSAALPIGPGKTSNEARPFELAVTAVGNAKALPAADAFKGSIC